MPSKNYYFIEDLDVTNDNIPDGVLVRQVRINDRTKRYSYIKNSYISHRKLQEILQDISHTTDTKTKNRLLVSNRFINQVKNKHVAFYAIPRVLISKKSHFAHMLRGKNIDLPKLIKDLNKLFSS